MLSNQNKTITIAQLPVCSPSGKQGIFMFRTRRLRKTEGIRRTTTCGQSEGIKRTKCGQSEEITLHK